MAPRGLARMIQAAVGPASCLAPAGALGAGGAGGAGGAAPARGPALDAPALRPADAAAARAGAASTSGGGGGDAAGLTPWRRHGWQALGQQHRGFAAGAQQQQQRRGRGRGRAWPRGAAAAAAALAAALAAAPAASAGLFGGGGGMSADGVEAANNKLLSLETRRRIFFKCGGRLGAWRGQDGGQRPRPPLPPAPLPAPPPSPKPSDPPDPSLRYEKRIREMSSLEKVRGRAGGQADQGQPALREQGVEQRPPTLLQAAPPSPPSPPSPALNPTTQPHLPTGL
jgi:hypothetical protein